MFFLKIGKHDNITANLHHLWFHFFKSNRIHFLSLSSELKDDFEISFKRENRSLLPGFKFHLFMSVPITQTVNMTSEFFFVFLFVFICVSWIWLLSRLVVKAYCEITFGPFQFCLILAAMPQLNEEHNQRCQLSVFGTVASERSSHKVGNIKDTGLFQWLIQNLKMGRTGL